MLLYGQCLEGEMSMSKIKAAFFDVDATIYYHHIHDIPKSTKNALMRLKKQGIKVGIATSRCRYELKNMPKFFREFPFDAIISDGGALAMEQDSVIVKHLIEPALMERIIAFANARQRTFRYSTVTHDYFANTPRQVDKDIFFQLYLNTPIIKAYDHDEVLNVLIYVKDQKERDDLKLLLHGVSFVDHGPVIEINSGQIDKSDGVKALADHWNIKIDEIIGFGDGENDVHLLQSCGIGVAMGNGCEAVKQAADFVTKRIEDDGVDFALRHFGL